MFQLPKNVGEVNGNSWINVYRPTSHDLQHSFEYSLSRYSWPSGNSQTHLHEQGKNCTTCLRKIRLEPQEPLQPAQPRPYTFSCLSTATHKKHNQTKPRVECSNVIDNSVTGKKNYMQLLPLHHELTSTTCMRSGLKVAFACMSQDGEGVLSIKFNVIVNGVISHSLVLVYW